MIKENAFCNPILSLLTSFYPRIFSIKEFNTTPIREVSLVYSRNYTKRRLLDLIAEEIKYALPIGMLNKDRGQIVEWK